MPTRHEYVVQQGFYRDLLCRYIEELHIALGGRPLEILDIGGGQSAIPSIIRSLTYLAIDKPQIRLHVVHPDRKLLDWIQAARTVELTTYPTDPSHFMRTHRKPADLVLFNRSMHWMAIPGSHNDFLKEALLWSRDRIGSTGRIIIADNFYPRKFGEVAVETHRKLIENELYPAPQARELISPDAIQQFGRLAGLRLHETHIYPFDPQIYYIQVLRVFTES